MSPEDIWLVSSDAAEGFLTRQFERQNGKDFLSERQQELTLRKSPNPPISLGDSPAPSETELTVPSKDNNKVIQDREYVAPSNSSFPSTYEPHLIDCRDLSATQLRRKYPREYETWKNMKQRAKGHIDPQFVDFRDFLAYMKPCKGGTLDRCDPSDPEYAPGKVRWADKRTQSNNRRNVRLVQTPLGPKTTAEIAKLQKVAKSTIRMRLKNAWSDQEIWVGKRLPRTATSPAPTSPSIAPTVEDERTPKTFFLPKPDLKPVWEKALAERFHGEWHEVTPRIKMQLNDFILRCSAGYLLNHAEALLAHTIKNWLTFTNNAKEGYGAFGSIPSRPNMTFLLRYLDAAVNLYLYDNDLEFIGTRVQPRAALRSKPSEPALAQPAPRPYITPNVDQEEWNDQFDADDFA